MKRIVDIPDEVLESKHYCQYFGAWSTKLTELIEQSTLYNPSGDLISRSDLKAELEVYRHDETRYVSDEEEAQNRLLDNILEDIDNAPTIDLWQMRQEATENALKKAEVLYGRPQGEWVIDGHHRRCKKCGEYFCMADSEGNEIPSNFCPNCGVDMRRGGAE